MHTPRSLVSRLLICLLVGVMGIAPIASANAPTVQLARYVEQIAVRLPPVAAAALQQIEGPSRQLLAARSYLRAGAGLTERWSWTQQRIDAHASSREYAALVADVERVRQRFELQNPGYTLYANTRVRSLDEQIVKFNKNPGVSAAARSLESAVLRELATQDHPATVDRLVEFLKDWRPHVAAPLAAPGLSMHGQLRAIDFQVMKGNQIVAGTDVSNVRLVWEQQGWKRKLQLAMDQSRFKGPLQSPNEPWHYEYLAADARLARNEQP